MSRNTRLLLCEYSDDKGFSIHTGDDSVVHYKLTDHGAIQITKEEFEALVNKPKDRPKPKADWIWNKPNSLDQKLNEKIDDVEHALGFPLFYWQREYILTGVMRCYGASTAVVLSLLLNGTDRPSLSHQKLYQLGFSQTDGDFIREIYNKLNAAGIKTREIIF